MTNFSIITIVTDQDLPKYQEKRNKLLGSVEEKDVLNFIEGVNSIPVIGGPGQMGLLTVPYCMVETVCTEEEYNAWKFSHTLIK